MGYDANFVGARYGKRLGIKSGIKFRREGIHSLSEQEGGRMSTLPVVFGKEREKSFSRGRATTSSRFASR